MRYCGTLLPDKTLWKNKKTLTATKSVQQLRCTFDKQFVFTILVESLDE